MRYLIIIVVVLMSCSTQGNNYASMDAAENALTNNYKQNEYLFEYILDDMVSFKHILYLKFKGKDRVSIIYMEKDFGKGINIENKKLSSSKVKTLLEMESMTQSDIEKLREKLKSINCESITMYRQTNYQPKVGIAHFCFGHVQDFNITYQVYQDALDSMKLENWKTSFKRYKNGGVLGKKVLWFIDTDAQL